MHIHMDCISFYYSYSYIKRVWSIFQPNFFPVFCLLILINGSNFIDGLNGLMLGYFSSIVLLIFYFNLYLYLEIDETFLMNFIIILFYLFILNINNKLFMGDSGSYVLGLICGYLLINIHQSNPSISSFFIVLLLWYPCFGLVASKRF